VGLSLRQRVSLLTYKSELYNGHVVGQVINSRICDFLGDHSTSDNAGLGLVTVENSAITAELSANLILNQLTVSKPVVMIGF
jgi:hypothetical protein